MGVPIGVAMSLFVVAYLEPLLGWRGCFYALGGIGLVLAAIMFFMKETPRRHEVEAQKRQAEAEAAAIERPSVKEMLAILVAAFKRSPALLMTVLGGVAFHFVLGAATFEQLWFVQERGFDRTEIAELSGWLAFAGGIAGNLFGGAGGDIFLRKTGMGRPMFLFWIMLILTPISLYYRVVEPTSMFFLLGIFVNTFSLAVSTARRLPRCKNWCRHRFAVRWWRSILSLSFLASDWRDRRRNFCGLDDRRERCAAVYGDLISVYGSVIDRDSIVLFCWTSLRARQRGFV